MYSYLRADMGMKKYLLLIKLNTQQCSSSTGRYVASSPEVRPPAPHTKSASGEDWID